MAIALRSSFAIRLTSAGYLPLVEGVHASRNTPNADSRRTGSNLGRSSVPWIGMLTRAAAWTNKANIHACVDMD